MTGDGVFHSVYICAIDYARSVRAHVVVYLYCGLYLYWLSLLCILLGYIRFLVTPMVVIRSSRFSRMVITHRRPFFSVLFVSSEGPHTHIPGTPFAVFDHDSWDDAHPAVLDPFDLVIRFNP